MSISSSYYRYPDEDIWISMSTIVSPKITAENLPAAADEKELDLGQRVQLTMQRLGYTELHGVKCVAFDGHIRLRGTLKSFFLKQVAQSIAMKTPGVRRVINEIKVSE